MTISLPRPLKPGEFYCHVCNAFIPNEKYSEHKKFHEKQQKATT